MKKFDLIVTGVGGQGDGLSLAGASHEVLPRHLDPETIAVETQRGCGGDTGLQRPLQPARLREGSPRVDLDEALDLARRS